jgi:cytochrome P450
MAILRNARDKSPAFTSKKAQRGLSDAPELPDGANLSDTEALTHNLLTMLVAGFDTTAVTLAWTLYLLSFDEDLQEKLFAEAHAPLSVGHDGGARGILRAHPLMLSVIREAMRLYPPVALIGRTAVQPLTMGDLQIKPGSLVLLSMYSMHRHEAHWKDPDRFDPYRFMDPDAESQAAYMPFGFGPRICIGQHLAELELVTMLSRMMRAFRFKRVTARPPKPIMTLTLRPEGGLWLIPIPR